MRKRITVFVVLMMVLCLTLTGCGQNTDKQEANRPGENFDTGDSSIMDGTNNPDGSTTEHEAITDTNDESIPDGAVEEAARNEEQSNSDGYSYNVAGYTLTCRTKIEDYIGEGGDGVFMFNDLAKDLGWHARNPEDDGNPELMRYFWDSNNEYDVGFDYPSGGQYFEIEYGDGTVRFSREDIDDDSISTYYVNYGGIHHVNYEQIVIITYLLENARPDSDDPLNGVIPYEDGTHIRWVYK